MHLKQEINNQTKTSFNGTSNMSLLSSVDSTTAFYSFKHTHILRRPDDKTSYLKKVKCSGEGKKQMTLASLA